MSGAWKGGDEEEIGRGVNPGERRREGGGVGGRYLGRVGGMGGGRRCGSRSNGGGGTGDVVLVVGLGLGGWRGVGGGVPHDPAKFWWRKVLAYSLNLERTEANAQKREKACLG